MGSRDHDDDKKLTRIKITLELFEDYSTRFCLEAPMNQMVNKTDALVLLQMAADKVKEQPSIEEEENEN